MSNTEELRKYLIDNDGFLLNDDNNGKTIMLSGAWGSGKTHFWQNEIEPLLSDKLKEDNKACVYVSLYGKDNIESLKNEILFKAYESIKEENQLAKRAISAFGFGSRLLSVSVGGVKANTSAVGDVVEGFFEGKKIDEAESFLADGGLICLDDFERKSKHIDLNDLFGFIAQLAIDMNCKIVIILNSDVFEGEEADVFKTVKEKTVNKFFYFKPSIEELFHLIAYDEKYDALQDYKQKILSAINETGEMNARIYIQVLDNCFEWIDKGYDDGSLRILILTTINFILNNFILDYANLVFKRSSFGGKACDIRYKLLDKYPEKIANFSFVNSDNLKDFLQECSLIDNDKFFEKLIRLLNGKTKEGQAIYTSAIQQEYLSLLKQNENELKAIWKYGYRLYYFNDITEEEYVDIMSFVKTGILPRKIKEVETSVPPKVTTETEA